MKITVVGTGYVGLVTGVCLATLGHNVTCFDIDGEKIERIQCGNIPIYEPGLQQLMELSQQDGRLSFTKKVTAAYKSADIIMIAVGTPQKRDGKANLSYIKEACQHIGAYGKNRSIVVTKSTVPVGTNDKIKEWIEETAKEPNYVQVVSNPEFLREGCGVHDFFRGDRIVIGGEGNAREIVAKLYEKLDVPIFLTDVRSAEMVKYASNAFLATKISFINEISNICEQVGADITDVAAGVGMDRRIGSQFLQAGIGYGGSCFPKDTKALVQIAGDVDHDFQLLKAVIEVNNKQQIALVEKAKRMMNLGGKKVAVLGLSFKPNTDDIREAPSLTIIQQLLQEGAHVTAYDPKAVQNVKCAFLNQIQYTTCIDEAITGAELAFIVTEWSSICTYEIEKYVQLMKEPILFDGRNCYRIKDMENYRVDYYSVGRVSICNRRVSRIV